MDEAERLREWLDLIRGIAYDRDGCATAESLGQLVDELYEMAGKALNGEQVKYEVTHAPNNRRP